MFFLYIYQVTFTICILKPEIIGLNPSRQPVQGIGKQVPFTV